MSERSRAGLRRLVDEARDETVTSALLALRQEQPSERSRRDLLAGLGLDVHPEPRAAEQALVGRRHWQRLRSALLGLSLGILLGLAWALYRHYGQ